jgi:hypothetical protein
MVTVGRVADATFQGIAQDTAIRRRIGAIGPELVRVSQGMVQRE